MEQRSSGGGKASRLVYLHKLSFAGLTMNDPDGGFGNVKMACQKLDQSLVGFAFVRRRSNGNDVVALDVLFDFGFSRPRLDDDPYPAH